MEHRKIGSLTVSVAGLGCNNFGWRLDYDHTATVVDAALDAGINFFDTADIYGAVQSEEYLGRALQGAARQGGARHQVRHEGGRRQRKGAKPDIRPAGASRTACAGCAPTTSTSTSSISPIRRRRSPTPSARSTSWCGPARCARSAARTSPPRSSGRRATRRGTARSSSASRTNTACCTAIPSRGPARMRAPGAGVPPLLSARRRRAHRQVPRRPADP